MYDDLDYAAKRLNSTMVRLNTGEPFYVENTYLSPTGDIRHIGTQMIAGTTVDVLHTDLDLTPIPLGFVNVSKRMVFIERKPMRRDWHQGLHHNSIATCGVVRPDQVQLSWLIQPITNQYPTFQRALKDLTTRISIAFSRDFGLEKAGADTLLRYRRYIVGNVVDGRLSLLPNKIFLQQHLEEVVGM